MPIKCPSGTSKSCRYKKTSKNNVMLRLCGCLRNNKFIKNGVKEVDKIIKKVKDK